MLQKYKKLIILVVIIIGGFFAYNSFFNTEISNPSSLEVTNSVDILGSDIIKAINQINALKLDRSVFEDPIFRTLVDRSEEIQPQQKSRPNPFAPIGNIDFNVDSSDNTDLNFETNIEDDGESAETEEPSESEIPSGL